MVSIQRSPRESIIYWVLNYESTKGHLKWNVADVARSAKMGRTVIYYHFGKSKKEILINCLTELTHEYFGFTEERKEMLKNGQIAESLLKTRAMLLENPTMATLYQKVRTTSSPIEYFFVALEKAYQEKLRFQLPSLNESEVVMYHAFFHGILTAPFLDEKNFKESAYFLETLIMKKRTDNCQS